MNRETRLFRRRPSFRRPEPPMFETGDYTVPDPPGARFPTPDDPFVTTDFDDGESTTITR